MQIQEDLYQQIVATMPIACVDLLVRNPSGKVLLLKRRNSPAKGQWWFPGGRVLFNERLSDAVRRKAKQECGLTLPPTLQERGIFELLFCEGSSTFHSVSVLFECTLEHDSKITIDSQSSEYIWADKLSLQKYSVHDFIKNALN
jgi:colanic acid biosynthesis protein WcaH